MDHRVFRFATRGQGIKGKYKHIFCFKLKCASIVYLLCTALWWQIKRRSGPLSLQDHFVKVWFGKS